VNIFNRLLAMILLAALVVACALTALLVAGVLGAAQVASLWPYGPVAAIAADIARIGSTARPIVLAGTVIAGALCLALLVAECATLSRRVEPWKSPGYRVRLRSDGPGLTEVVLGSLDDVVRYSARGISGIESVRGRVSQPRDGTLAVRCDAYITPHTDLPAAGVELERRIAERLEGLTGIPVRDVRIRALMHQTKSSGRRPLR